LRRAISLEQSSRKFVIELKVEEAVMAEDDDGVFGSPPRKAAASHEIGQNVDDLSAQEITLRIAIFRAEITRLEEARIAKHASLGAADAFFKFDRSR
jgi:uncharacterized small protein (DUF1192 family)